MRIDGALMPHQGVFAQENSTGVHISSLSDKNRSMQCHKTYVQSVCSSQSDDNIILFNRKLLQQQKQKYMQIYKWKNAKSIICDSDSDKVRDSNSNYDSHGDINNANSLLNIACNSHKNQATIQPVLTSDIQNSIPIEIKRNNLYIWRIQDKQNQIKANALSKSTIGKNRVMTAKQQDKPEQFNKIDQLCNLIYSKFTLNSETINWATFLAFIQFYWHLSFECIISSNDYNVAPIKAVMRTIQSFNIHSNVTLILCTLLLAINCCVWPHYVLADEEEHSITVNNVASTIISEFSTTTEFDYAVRGDKKFGDKCENTMECGFPGSICDAKKKSCQCIEDLPITNHIDKCGKEAAVNESCFFNEQCEAKYFQTECRDGRCTCRFEMTPIWLKDGTIECKGRQENKTPEVYVDWAMIGVLIGMALMFIIICIVLRLFSQARWHENRTIFNTPNPRLMNVSLLRESKLLHGQERRGSRMSVRGPSRQPSMTSLRPHSPNPSLGSRSNSNSNNSAASLRSNSIVPGLVVNNGHHHHERRGSTYQTHTHSHQHQHHHPKSQSPPPAAHHYQSHQQHQPHHESHNQPHHHHQQQQQQPLMTNIISNPVAESVTVEILEPNNK